MRAIRIISIFLLLLVAVNALAAGYLFIVDPSGSRLGITISWLKHSPFQDFLIPGMVLFMVNGVFNLVAALFATFKWDHYARLIAFQGMILTGWIIVQMIFMRDIHFLHVLLGAIGVTLFMFGNRLNV